MGQFITYQMVIILTTGILFAVFAMAVSELIKNSMAVMGIMLGMFILSQIELFSPKLRILTQPLSRMPSDMISMSSLLEHRLINAGGHLITQYVAAPVIYVVIAIGLVIAGGIAYNRFQVSGR